MKIPITSYIVSAIRSWIIDNGETPMILFDWRAMQSSAPVVANEQHEVVLNVSPTAIGKFHLTAEGLELTARFRGVSHVVSGPVSAIKRVYSRESLIGTDVESLVEATPIELEQPAESSKSTSDEQSLFKIVK